MGVSREKVDNPELPFGAVRATHAERTPDGFWRLVLAVDATIPLPDGRKLRFEREVIVRGRQIGRKRSASEYKPWLHTPQCMGTHPSQQPSVQPANPPAEPVNPSEPTEQPSGE